MQLYTDEHGNEITIIGEDTADPLVIIDRPDDTMLLYKPTTDELAELTDQTGVDN